MRTFDAVAGTTRDSSESFAPSSLFLCTGVSGKPPAGGSEGPDVSSKAGASTADRPSKPINFRLVSTLDFSSIFTCGAEDSALVSTGFSCGKAGNAICACAELAALQLAAMAIENASRQLPLGFRLLSVLALNLNKLIATPQQR